MRNVKTILRYILSIILTIAIIIFIIANVAKTTILDKNYVLSKLDETSYYVKIYGYIKENFKNYIQQSGFEESILDDVISEEQVRLDTQKVITNIYNNVNEEITAEELKTKLSENIKKATINMILTTEQQNAIDGFINDLTNEYLIGIAHFDFEKTIYNAFDKAKDMAELGNKISLVIIPVAVIALLAISTNRIYKFFVFIGIACTSSGLFFEIINIYINSNIKVQTITILNDAFSFTLREILDSTLGMFKTNAANLLLLGIPLIIVPLFVHNFKKYKNEIKPKN